MNRLLYFCALSEGGLAEYSHEQANAIARLGVEVTMLAPQDFASEKVRKYQLIQLPGLLRTYRIPILRKLHYTYVLFKQYQFLAQVIKKKNFNRVIIGSFAEYFSPIWSRTFRKLAKDGVRFGAVIHDPVRDFVLGPTWWHHLSIACAYSFLSEAFVHESITLDTVRTYPGLTTTVIPHGPYRFPKSAVSRQSTRERLKIPDDARLILSFGHIRNGKNLDLMIQAMTVLPDVFLLVAGKEQSSWQKPITFYQDLARKLGVQDRCRWIHGYIAQEDSSELFVACDLVLLTYSGDFKSASGVLNAGIQFRKPCIASCGGGNLKSVVERYQFGIFVKPDDVQSLIEGLRSRVVSAAEPRWEEYESENSWEINARSVVGRMSAPLPKNVLVFAPSVSGGIAEHTYYQAIALKKAGAKVTCLIAPSFLKGRKTDFDTVVCLPNPIDGITSLMKKLRMALGIISSQYVLAWQIIKHRPDLILLDSYMEYLSPLWVDPHILLSRIFGFRYAANLHDPVRSYSIGPKWWHRLSIWLAYQPLDFVLVHDKMPVPSPVPPRVLSIQVPVGVYEIRPSAKNRDEIRREWGVQAGQKVFLSFGYVRDGKNLDLAIRALVEVPEAFLVIAGSVASSKDRTYQEYKALASQLGVVDRCRFFEGFVSDEALGGYFEGTDFVLLTYSANFHSQSGVLNIAAKALKPVLASAAPSPLMESVKAFSLGVSIPPDELDPLIWGMKELISNTPDPRWDKYEAAASWGANARAILQALDSLPRTSHK
jgi:glycosyltransferase involved in cell wall biosynthesis